MFKDGGAIRSSYFFFHLNNARNVKDINSTKYQNITKSGLIYTQRVFMILTRIIESFESYQSRFWQKISDLLFVWEDFFFQISVFINQTMSNKQFFKIYTQDNIPLYRTVDFLTDH